MEAIKKFSNGGMVLKKQLPGLLLIGTNLYTYNFIWLIKSVQDFCEPINLFANGISMGVVLERTLQ